MWETERAICRRFIFLLTLYFVILNTFSVLIHLKEIIKTHTFLYYFQDNNDHGIEIPEASTHLSVTTVLEYCKIKILNPYLSFLSFVGLRLWICQRHDSWLCLKMLPHMYTVFVVSLLFLGYIFQYMSCFRRDRGFCNMGQIQNFFTSENIDTLHRQTCDGSLVFSFLIPSMLHLTGYLYAIIVTRTSDDEQIPILMERVSN